VERFRIGFEQPRKESFGEILVEKKAHSPRLRGWDSQDAALTLSREGEAREHILVSQLWKLIEQLGLSATRTEKAQDFANCDAGAPNARLPEPNLGIHCNAFKPPNTHRLTVDRRRSARNPRRASRTRTMSRAVSEGAATQIVLSQWLA
jgi:hypothetical protein